MRSVVKLVSVNTIDFGDVEVDVGGEGAEEAGEEFEEDEAEVGREEGVEECLAEGEYAE